MSWAGKLGAGVALAALAFVAITAWTLLTGDIATVQTRGSDGELRSTSVWYADMNGYRWLEAGAPENAWFRDIGAGAEIELTTSTGSGAFRAEPVPEAVVREALRRRMRARYGFRDQWVGIFVDHERSVPVRLHPIDKSETTP